MPLPKRFKTAKDLDDKINDYFAKCRSEETIPTIPGLCVHLDYASKQSFYDLEKVDRYKDVIKKARLRLEDAAWNRSRPMDIFYLKNHHGMADKHEQEIKLDADVKSQSISIEMTAEKASELYQQMIDGAKNA